MPIYNATCATCGKAFSASRGFNQDPPKFCSRQCHYRTVTKPCARCGVEFKVKFGIADKTLYCSKTCAYAALRVVPDATCQWCGKVYRPYGHGSGDKFCSSECTYAYRRSLPVEDREAMMANCRDATRGMVQTDEHRFKIARTKQERAILSGDEADIMAGFNEQGLFPIPLYAIHRYNIDFAFPDVKLAIEYNGGNWHNTPAKRTSDAVKTAWLESNGWTVVFFPRIDKPQPNNAGNARITVEDLVSEVQRILHHIHSQLLR